MGDGRFDKIGDTNVADDCIHAGVNFIDINADGLDDFVCIAKDGTAYASINQGDGSGTRPPSFRQIGKIKDSEGYPQSRVRLADVDGDGRADYCVLEDNGDTRCWRNGWIDDIPEYWQPLGKRFTGKGMGDINGVRFEDVNGDGRDDWLWLDEVGQTTMYSNARSCQKGQEGNGLNIVWRPGYAKGRSSGPTHHGMGGYASDDDEDFGLLGKQDYVFMEHVEEEENQHRFNMRVWKNTGAGGTKIKADGNRYCNMLGHDNGMMDYVWILLKGDMHLYTNQGKTTVENDGPNFWGPNYKIFDPMSEIGRDLDRRDLHLADWDGDGVCDIIWTDPSNQNRVQLWRNRYKQDGQFNWEHDPNPAPQLYCPETRGLGFFDRPVHFADISGNRGWEYLDQIKFAEGKDRANLQWADVNGDRMADLIHTNKFNGDGTVWLNKGRKDIGGSRWHWDTQGVRFQGAQARILHLLP
ncbi:hypothetical protein BJX66DRAFT_345814 [Aspergillus keveii]|uniref:FG-GAP repeat protein n=1 Tax=Aspergillus keveii TaxID=714993 RepID=A0ABR4FGV4_9EURO